MTGTTVTPTMAKSNRASGRGATATYFHDAEGRRVRETTSAGWRDYIYDSGGSPVAELTATGWDIGYVYFGSSIVAQYQGGTTYFVPKDHIGSTRLITDVNGYVYDSMDYLPFGEQIAGDTGSKHKFTGKERDTESGLDNFGARYDASSLGRFMTPDPVHILKQKLVDPQQWNMYAYVRNNPLRFVDPKGKWIELTGSDEERKKQLQALQGAVGKQAGQYLYDNAVTTTDGNGNKVINHYVGIRDNGPDGKGSSFGSIMPQRIRLGDHR